MASQASSDTAPGPTSATPIVDSDDPKVTAFAKSKARGCESQLDAAVRVYYAVRDGVRYDPYTVDLSPEGLSASRTLDTGRGWCVAKSVLLTACYRALGIPARLGFADVRNHLSTKRMRESMETDVFYWHGYTAVQLEGRWVKATPAFNVELCEKFGFLPLEFDGRNDSLYHPFDREGKKHMEYLHDRGVFDDLPLESMLETFAEHYGTMLGLAESSLASASFDEDVAAEVSGSVDAAVDPPDPCESEVSEDLEDSELRGG